MWHSRSKEQIPHGILLEYSCMLCSIRARLIHIQYILSMHIFMYLHKDAYQWISKANTVYTGTACGELYYCIWDTKHSDSEHCSCMCSQFYQCRSTHDKNAPTTTVPSEHTLHVDVRIHLYLHSNVSCTHLAMYAPSACPWNLANTPPPHTHTLGAVLKLLYPCAIS